MDASADITGLLHRWREGDEEALDRLIPLLYDALRGMARDRLAAEQVGHTLDSGALVHEAYLRLVEIDRVQWTDRAHFLAVAARVMRRVLIDHAKRRSAAKRGGGVRPGTLREELIAGDADIDTLIELDDALRKLDAEHPRQARALELHYFGGLTQEETAAALGTSQPTVARDLRFGRAWLASRWGDAGEGPADRGAGPGAQG